METFLWLWISLKVSELIITSWVFIAVFGFLFRRCKWENGNRNIRNWKKTMYTLSSGFFAFLIKRPNAHYGEMKQLSEMCLTWQKFKRHDSLAVSGLSRQTINSCDIQMSSWISCAKIYADKSNPWRRLVCILTLWKFTKCLRFFFFLFFSLQFEFQLPA